MTISIFHDDWQLSKMSDVINPDALKMEAGALMPAILTQPLNENHLLSAPGSPIADLSSDTQVAYFYPSHATDTHQFKFSHLKLFRGCVYKKKKILLFPTNKRPRFILSLLTYSM